MGFRTTLGGRQNISYLGEDPIQRHAFLTQAISDPTVFTMPSHKRAAALHLKMIGRKRRAVYTTKQSVLQHCCDIFTDFQPFPLFI
ncbi:uncharacterized protein LOC142827203 isoform X5 [Pelodiscus sinensis]|uniref:uncharacterized protein LOC142827203 isoform X5 n=1 Tax=Pelodiscus sinensis TaxID=13735 RepID=UPI003F6AD359